MKNNTLLPFTVALIAEIREYNEFREIYERTGLRISEMQEEIRGHENKLLQKEKADGDPFKIGEEMAVLQNGIRILKNRLEPVKARYEQEQREAAAHSISPQSVQKALLEYLDALATVRVAALHALCDEWNPAYNYNPVILAIAHDSEDFAPYLDILESVEGSRDGAGLAARALPLLSRPLPQRPGEWKMNVKLDWTAPPSLRHIRDAARHQTEEAFRRHAQRCRHRVNEHALTGPDKVVVTINYHNNG